MLQPQLLDLGGNQKFDRIEQVSTNCIGVMSNAASDLQNLTNKANMDKNA